jgi:hypothetical protein
MNNSFCNPQNVANEILSSTISLGVPLFELENSRNERRFNEEITISFSYFFLSDSLISSLQLTKSSEKISSSKEIKLTPIALVIPVEQCSLEFSTLELRKANS